MLKENEIVVSAHALLYRDIENTDKQVVISKNNTRRRVYNGYYFEDTGCHIYVSTYCSHIFQHKNKMRSFIVNKETKEWRDYQTTFAEHHKPDKENPVENNEVITLIR